MTIYDIIKELGITKGWSPLLGDCEIDLDDTSIWIRTKDSAWTVLNEEGKYEESGECVLFPSKNKDWNEALDDNKKKLIPPFTPVMASDDGENWSVKYYMNGQFCSISKNSIYGSVYKYMVPLSKFDFEADDLFINIKNSI